MLAKQHVPDMPIPMDEEKVFPHTLYESRLVRIFSVEFVKGVADYAVNI